MTRLEAGQVRILSRIRLDAVTLRPYYAAAVFALQPVASPGLGTVAVDARGRLYVDFDALALWEPQERAGALIHEVSHLLHRHHDRARRYGAALAVRRWNVAADAEINDGIGVRLPLGAITPESLGLEPHRLAEHYYDRICGEAELDRLCGGVAGGGPRPWEQASDAPGLDPLEVDAVRERVAADIRNRSAGTVAVGDQRWAQSTSATTVDWRRELRAAIAGAGRTSGASQWTYSRPPRRRPPGPGPTPPSIYVPTSTVAVVVDTSGSVTDAELDLLVSETVSICRAMPGSTVHLLSCDTEATYHGRMGSARSLRLTGGGGTDMVAGIDAALALRPRPDHIIVATDGETRWPAAPPRGSNIVALLVGEQPGPTPPRWVRRVEAGAGRWSGDRIALRDPRV